MVDCWRFGELGRFDMFGWTDDWESKPTLGLLSFLLSSLLSRFGIVVLFSALLSLVDRRNVAGCDITMASSALAISFLDRGASLAKAPC
jgi:hypothetical protein